MKDIKILLMIVALATLSACGGGGGGKDLGAITDDPPDNCGLTTCNDGGGDDDDDDDDGGDGEPVLDFLDFSNRGFVGFDTLDHDSTRALEMDFSGNDFVDLNGMYINVYTGATKLTINNNSNFLSMEGLADFIDLEEISGNTFNDGVCTLDVLTNLKVLDIPSYGVGLEQPLGFDDISCLDGFSSLEKINLFGANIEPGTPISFLDGLESLTNIDTRMVEFSGVNENTINKSGMSYIDLNGSRSSDPLSLSFLAPSYQTLQTLDLKTIEVTDVQALAEFTALTFLSLTLPNDYVLDENGGQDLSELYANLFAGSTQLAHLDLSNSGEITAPAIFRNFASLEGRSLNTLLLGGNYNTIDAENDGYLGTLSSIRTLDLSNMIVDYHSFLDNVNLVEFLYLNELELNVDPMTAFDFLGDLERLVEFEVSTTQPFEAFDTSVLSGKPALEKIVIDINPRDPSLTGMGLPYFTTDFVTTSPLLRHYYVRGSVTNENIVNLYDNDFVYLDLRYSLLDDYSLLNGIEIVDNDDQSIGEIYLPLNVDVSVMTVAPADGAFCMGWSSNKFAVIAPLTYDDYCQ
jgi:hypothetical protein